MNNNQMKIVPVEPTENQRHNAAHRLVRAAIKKGDLIRPDCCNKCGNRPGKASDGRSLIQGHHNDYSKPLEVEWLCAKCHREVTPYPEIRGTPHYGEKNWMAKLTASKVLEARKLKTEGLSYSAIAKIFGVERSTMVKAIMGTNWGSVKSMESNHA